MLQLSAIFHEKDIQLRIIILQHQIWWAFINQRPEAVVTHILIHLPLLLDYFAMSDHLLSIYVAGQSTHITNRIKVTSRIGRIYFSKWFVDTFWLPNICLFHRQPRICISFVSLFCTLPPLVWSCCTTVKCIWISFIWVPCWPAGIETTGWDRVSVSGGECRLHSKETQRSLCLTAE